MASQWLVCVLVILALLPLLGVNGQNRPPFSNNTKYNFDVEVSGAEIEHEEAHGIVIAEIHLTEESQYSMVAVTAIMIGTFARFGLEILEIHVLPESALVIIFGFFVGLIMWAADNVESFDFDNEIFFLILIPPIIFESGYHMDRPSFFENVRLILMYALIGTSIVSGAMGAILYAAKDTYDFDLSVVEALTFGSLIAAVDPVAVISIFHEMNVNETLHILVFGESVLNDAISIVLYNVFLGLDGVSFTWDIPFLAFGKFLYVAIGGLMFGTIVGIATCIFLRFIKPEWHLHPMEAGVVVVLGWMAYLAAETFLMSGIVSSLFAGITMNRYGYTNMHANSKITTNYVLYILAGTTETIIFVFLGMQSLFTPFALNEDSTWNNTWDTGTFVIITLICILPIRFALTYGMGYIDNIYRIEKIDNENLFIIAYGGLRGAIAFALAWELPQEWEARNVMINSVIICIWFTVFVQGATIGPFIRWFRVKRKEAHEPTLSERVLPRVFPHVTASMREIYGKHRAGFFVENLLKIDKFLEGLINREDDPEAELKNAIGVDDDDILRDFTKATTTYKGPIGKAPDIDYGLDLNKSVILDQSIMGRNRASMDQRRSFDM